MGIRDKPIAPRSPWQNGFAERLIGSIRRFGNLARNPIRRWAARYSNMDELSAVEPNDDEAIKHAEGERRHDEQVHRGDLWHMVAQKCPPALARRSAVPLHVLRDGGLSDFEPKFQQLAMDAGSAPERAIDDPVQIRHAADLDRLKYVNDLFDGEIRSRLDNKSEGRILIIAHRLNDDDLTGYVLRQGGWHHLALPLVARRDVHYLLPSGVWHRQKGDTLRPDSYTKREVEHLRKTNPNFEALYQQNTRPARLARIKASHFGTFAREDLPPEPVVLSVDPAGAAGSDNSFTVIQAWVKDKERHCLLDHGVSKPITSRSKRRFDAFPKSTTRRHS
jgi:hypothetical protein